jgi:dolichyl-phosphate-mannose--protein O-mannosyl transferase
MSTGTRTRRVADWVGWSAILLIAGALRLTGIASPGTLYFDEYYYARQACFQTRDTSVCGFKDERRPVHPPLGRWLIAAGIRAFGNNPLGWRIAPALAGTLTVGLLYLLARRLLNSTAAAVTASGLLAIDVLHFIHSRLAMLDVFVVLFVVAAALCCLYDREQILSGRLRPRAGPLAGLRDHPWRIAAGAAVGAAAASKWPGAFILPAIVLLTIGWELSAPSVRGMSIRGMKEAAARVLREESLSLGISFVVVPLLVYAASYAGTIQGSLLAWPWSEGSWLRSLIREQVLLYRIHAALTQSHRLHAPPWLWFSPMRPVIYHSQFDGSAYRIIASIGNPCAWWTALLALGYLALTLLRGRGPRPAAAFILAGFAATYGPWLLLTGNRQPFQFYLLPAIPFMELALASTVVAVAGRRAARVLIPVWALLTLGFFISAYPWFTATKEPGWWWIHPGQGAVDCDWLRLIAPQPGDPTRC